MMAAISNNNLLGQTDVLIKQIADEAEAKLTARGRTSVVNEVYAVNSHSDISIRFPNMGQIMGCVLMPVGMLPWECVPNVWPTANNPDWYRYVSRVPILSVFNLNPSGGDGTVWAHLFAGPMYHPPPTYSSSNLLAWYQGPKPVDTGVVTSLRVCGIAWGPA